MATSINVNGKAQQVDVPAEMPLLWLLRDTMGLTGTKFGCGVGLCGACTVHVDGKAAKACVVTVGEMAGKKVTTIEAWSAHNVPQCGYCQAGQIMSGAALIAENKNPTDAQILEAMSGNICRCGCYQRIFAAVKSAAKGA
jgi:isoquinoline 1-oxidoreductase subunit alpha